MLLSEPGNAVSDTEAAAAAADGNHKGVAVAAD
jgi:hypothetical protein